MKTIALFLISFLLFVNTIAQIGFEEHIIDSGYTFVPDFIPADINGDGHSDILVRNTDNDTHFWFKNDGNGNFTPQQIIINTLASYVFAIDFDGDNDIDFIWSTPNNEVAFSENIDGLGNFAEEQILTSFTKDFYMSKPMDIDGDNDLDIVCAFHETFDTDTLFWVENIDGFGNFGYPQFIESFPDGAIESPHVTDIDGDGDFDIAIVHNYTQGFSFFSYISIFKNTNSMGAFEESQVFCVGSIGNNLFSADIDGDGDNDILYHDMWSLWLYTLINSDGGGNFISGSTVNQSSNDIWAFYPSDIDGDGDLDLTCTNGNYPITPLYSLEWYENTDGLGSFNVSHLIVNDYARKIDSKDIDGDGDFDIFASLDDHKIVWYENLSPLISIDENVRTKFSIYPNPTTGMLSMETEANILQIDVTNSLGQSVLTNSNKSSIDMTTLAQGLYILKITDVKGNVGFKKVLKE